jgi:hypothetical protein
MLSYKLAKKLKDAGFPQLGNGWALTVIDWNLYVHNITLHKKMMYCPTLSELIEACGEEFIELEYKNGSKDWVARGGCDLTGLEEEMKKGRLWKYAEWDKDRDIAVAKLWLKLNKIRNDKH